MFTTPDSTAKPFIGRIEAMWETYNTMMVKVFWFYHPEETLGLKEELLALKKELPYLVSSVAACRVAADCLARVLMLIFSLQGALFSSIHEDKNDVQTISHKCSVVSLSEYRERLKKEPERVHNVYQSNDLYYLAGQYDPKTTTVTFEDGVFP